jgi:tetratricopeptide (TPR) repeat protein
LRERTKRRLRWFVIAMLMLGIGGAAAYFVRDRQLEQRAVAGRDEGLRLLQGGDYFHAMHKIGPYVRRHPDDVEALLAYARARVQVVEPTGRHISEALGIFRRALSLNPHHVSGAESLLRLYEQCRFWTESLQLCKDLLAIDPKNHVALECRANALFSLGRFAGDEALHAAVEYTAAYPGEMAGHLLTLEIMQRGGSSREQILKRCEMLRRDHPQDPRFLVLTGVAHACLNENDAAREWLDQACRKEMPDAESLGLLVQYLDRLHRFDAAFAVLQRHGSKGGEFARLLTRRLWEQERFADIAQQVPENESDPERLALACLSLSRVGQKQAALQRLAKLEAASELKPEARIWAPVVKALIGNGEPDDPAVIAACRKALAEKPDPYIQFLAAEAYLSTGDSETALQLWQQIVPAATGWSAPLCNLGNAALSAGKYDDAVALARAALARKADSTAAMMLLAKAQVRGAASLDDATAARVLSLLDQIDHSSAPDPSTTPLRVRVLATIGHKDEAIATARQALAKSPPMPAASIIRLAELSESLRLGLEDECLARSEQAHGVTPDLAFVRAKRLADAGNKAQGVALFEKARAAAQGRSKGEWDAGWARLLELCADSRAHEAWVAAADGSPNDALLQWMAISATSVQSDRAFVGRVLDRLEQRLGDQGITWRLSRARWLLDGADSQNAVEAALILNDLTRSAPNMLAPRLLLADCLQRLGNSSGAIDQLTAAANLSPQSASIALQLARLLQASGDAERARVHLDRVVGNPAADPTQCHEAAELLEAQGDAKAALAALQKAYGAAMAQPPCDLLLARVYRRLGDGARLEAVCKRLAESSNAQDLGFAADYYTEQGRQNESTAVMARLQSASAAPGIKEILLGTHALRSRDQATALAQFTAATKAAPQNPQGWKQLARVQLIADDGDALLKTLQAAHAALPKDAGVAAALRQAPAALKLKQKWPELPAMLSDVMDVADEEQSIAGAADLLGSAGEGAIPSSVVTKLYGLASARPRMFALQVLTARVCLAAGRNEEACLLARRAGNMREEALPLAINALRLSQRWKDVGDLLRPRLQTSRQWRIEWMKLAATMLPDTSDAIAWLKEVEPLTMRADGLERLALAESWHTLAQRSGDQSAAAIAAAQTRQVAAELSSGKMTPQVALSLACLQEAAGDMAAAEAGYRKVLELHPQDAVAQNNLAMLLARRGQRLDEALQLAQRAAQANDANAVTFFDTLAFVHVQRKEFPAAIETLHAALKIKPDYLVCQIRLTDALAQSGQLDEARAALAALEKELPNRHDVTDELSSRVRDLRSRLSRQTS